MEVKNFNGPPIPMLPPGVHQAHLFPDPRLIQHPYFRVRLGDDLPALNHECISVIIVWRIIFIQLHYHSQLLTSLGFLQKSEVGK
jgi:hypothetical protein